MIVFHDYWLLTKDKSLKSKCWTKGSKVINLNYFTIVFVKVDDNVTVWHQFSIFNFQFSIELVELVRTWYGGGLEKVLSYFAQWISLLNCFFLFFSAKKRNRKSSPLRINLLKFYRLRWTKINSLRSDSIFVSTAQRQNFLTRFLRGGRDWRL